MRFPRWLRPLTARFDSPPARRTPRRRAFRPTLEVLEARDNPSGGVLDPTFGSGGIAALPNPGGDTYIAGPTFTAVQPDGKVIVLTTTDRPPVKGVITSEAVLSRLNSNGSLDTTFGTRGTVLLPVGKSNIGMSLALEPDGKILIASLAYPNSPSDREYAVARVNGNGTLDTTFGGAGTGWWVSNPSSRDEAITQLAVVPQGSSFAIYAGGGAALANGDLGVVVVQLTPAGVPATSFGSGGFAIRDTGCVGSYAPLGGSSVSGWGAVAVTSSGRVVVEGRLPRPTRLIDRLQGIRPVRLHLVGPGGHRVQRQRRGPLHGPRQPTGLNCVGVRHCGPGGQHPDDGLRG